MRKKPTDSYQIYQLNLQDNNCAYCGNNLFGAQYNSKRCKFIYPQLVWDHFIPYAYCQKNEDDNFVAACRICNGIKGSKMFNHIWKARFYIDEVRRKRGYNEVGNLPRMPEEFYNKESNKKVLPAEMSIKSLDEESSKNEVISIRKLYPEPSREIRKYRINPRQRKSLEIKNIPTKIIESKVVQLQKIVQETKTCIRCNSKLIFKNNIIKFCRICVTRSFKTTIMQCIVCRHSFEQYTRGNTICSKECSKLSIF